MDEMANHDFTKWEHFFKMPIIEFLNCVCYYKDRKEYEHDLNEKNQIND